MSIFADRQPADLKGTVDMPAATDKVAAG